MAEVDQAAFDAAVAATAAETKALLTGEVALSSGVVLRLKPVPPLLVRQAVMQLTKPTPPIVVIEDKGREEENPTDPAYVQALRDYELRTVEVGLNVMLLVGTEVVSVPEGFSRAEDDAWLEMLEALDISVPVDKPRARYLAWLRYYAIASAADIANITGAMAGSLGLQEEEVQEAAASFRGRKVRRTNSGLPAEAP